MSNLVRSLALATALAGAPLAAMAASCADTLVSTPELTRFAALVQQSGLAPQVSNGTLTVFAPTNAALNGIASVTQMLASQSNNASPDFPRLQTLVRAHLVSGRHPQSEMMGKVTLSTLAGTSIAIDGTTTRRIVLSATAAAGINLSGMQLMSNVFVAGPVLECDNGFVYPINNPLVQ